MVKGCIICLEKGDKKSFLQNPSSVALAKVLERTQERSQCFGFC